MKKVLAMVAAIVSGASLFKVMVRSLILKAGALALFSLCSETWLDVSLTHPGN